MSTDLGQLLERRESRLHVSLKPAELHQLDSLATNNNTSRSSIARALLLAGLERHAKQIA